MPPTTEHEPHNIFNEDLLQTTSFIDLLQNSPDVNMCYMSDDEPLGLPPMLPSTSELSFAGSSVSVLEMISQDGMLTNFQSTSNASTEVTYVAQGTAPSVAPFTSAGDVFLPDVSSTTTTIAQLLRANDSHAPAKTFFNLNSRPACGSTNLKPPPSTNPFMINPFVLNENQSARNPFAAARVEEDNDRSTCKNSSSSRKRSRCKTHGSHKTSSHSKQKKKSSHSSPKLHNLLTDGLLRKSHVSKAACTELKTTVTHTVTRTTSTVTQNTVTLTSVSVTHTTTVTRAVDHCTLTDSQTTAMSYAMSSVGMSGIIAITSSDCSSMVTSHTMTRAHAPTGIISPIQSTYLPANVLYSTPTIISRAAPTADRIREQFAILPTQTAFAISTGDNEGRSESVAPRARTRLVIPMSLNAFATSAASIEATAANKNRSQNVSIQVATTTNTSSIMSRPLGHSSFACATLFAARKLTNRRAPAAATEPHTFAIVDEKGTYTTLTISSDFTTATNTTTAAPIVMTPTQNMTAATARDCTSSVASDSPARPRSQLLIPIANSQMNTSTSLGYLVTSPIGSNIITTRGTTASSTLNSATKPTNVASHTITTISSEALNRIRNRLIYNIPSTNALSLPSTMSGDNRPRGPVTIITNQLVSGVNGREASTSAPSTATAPRVMFPAASQGLYAITTPASTTSPTSPAEPATRALNRVVIPINVHATSTSAHSVSTPGAYIIAGMSSSSSMTSDAVTRPSRVVIPIIHNASTATVASSSMATTSASRSSSIAPTDAYSKLRSRLTIQVGTTASSTPVTTPPITAYTITRTRAPQSLYAIPTRPASYMSTKSSECTRSPATMTFITFTPPSTCGGTSATHKTSHKETPSTITSATSATPTLTSTGNRFVIKLAGPGSASASSSVTTAITTPITSATFGTMDHHFTEPHTASTRLRTFPAPRTYSVAQRSAAANALQRSAAHNLNQRFKKTIANPSPLQIFADVVCPPTTTAPTQSNFNSRFTLSHNPGKSTLVVPHYKNTVFQNLSTVAHPNPARNGARLLGPRVSSERLVLNRSVALVSPRRAGPAGGTRDPRAPRSNATSVAAPAVPAASESTPVSDSQSSSNQDDQND